VRRYGFYVICNVAAYTCNPVVVRHYLNTGTALAYRPNRLSSGDIIMPIDVRTTPASFDSANRAQYVATTSGVVSGFFGGSGTSAIIIFSLP
jgi:hypothetical protein